MHVAKEDGKILVLRKELLGKQFTDHQRVRQMDSLEVS